MAYYSDYPNIIISDLIEQEMQNEKNKKLEDETNYNSILSLFPYKFLNKVGLDAKKLKRAKYHNSNKIGITGYIDYIILQNFIDHNTPIIYGIDSANRFFISLLFNKKNLDTENVSEKNIITFFQRYTGEDHFFVSCQTGFENYNSCITANFNNFDKELDNEYNILFKLLNEGSTIETFDNIKYEISLSQL